MWDSPLLSRFPGFGPSLSSFAAIAGLYEVPTLVLLQYSLQVQIYLLYREDVVKQEMRFISRCPHGRVKREDIGFLS